MIKLIPFKTDNDIVRLPKPSTLEILGLHATCLSYMAS